VIDAGSALTVDLVAASGEHEGGYIIPGPALMERALLLDTDRVRFEDAADYRLEPGTSTAEAVRHGIALAQAGAVALVMERTAEDPPTLVFCGGGGEVLMGLLGLDGEWVPDLVFEGLERLAADKSQAIWQGG
jgi:type III pantothenate kinase